MSENEGKSGKKLHNHYTRQVHEKVMNLQPQPSLTEPYNPRFKNTILYPQQILPAGASSRNSKNSSGRRLSFASLTKSDWETLNPSSQAQVEIDTEEHESSKFTKFEALFSKQSRLFDLEVLKKISWSGIPRRFRSTSWKLLLGYLPTNIDRQPEILRGKREEYVDFVGRLFDLTVQESAESTNSSAESKRRSSGPSDHISIDYTVWHQIHIDVNRTHPEVKIYQHPKIQKSLERVLYCWAIRHPASGYVQGINELVTPFYQVFLHDLLFFETRKFGKEKLYHKLNHTKKDPMNMYIPQELVDVVPQSDLLDVEADSFWCFSKLMDGIQDNYIEEQPGIRRQMKKMEEIIARIDKPLYTHLKSQALEFLQFAFRWMNCLLMREFSLENIIRMWDSYLVEEPDGFSDFHIYVCASFLKHWSGQLIQLEFQDLIIYLQSLPTNNWTEQQIQMMLSEAFMWKNLLEQAPGHLRIPNLN